MRLPTKLLVFTCVSILLFNGEVIGQDKKAAVAKKSKTGYVNFNLGKTPYSHSGSQELSFFGCNTYVSNRDSIWFNKKELSWDAKSQVMSIPYGYQGTGKDRYYVSKYYMASPPVFEPADSSTLSQGTKAQKKKDTIANIGLVMPDNFTFFGDHPVQIVHLNYTILKPVYLNYMGINYDYTNKGKSVSCDSLTVDLVPLNIQCKDFDWIDQNGIKAGQGASGIARIRSNQNEIFLPSYKPNGDECLDCKITILDDIIKDHEVFFVTGDSISKSLNLTQFYKATPAEKINLFCRVRTDGLPAGCRKAEGARGYIFEE